MQQIDIHNTKVAQNLATLATLQSYLDHIMYSYTVKDKILILI